MIGLLPKVPAVADPVGSWALVAAIGLLALAWIVRWDLFAHLAFERVDPRPAAVYRIVFGLVVLWAVLDLLPWAKLLFTDEGIFLTGAARRAYGGRLDVLWDPVEGFASPWSAVEALATRGSVLHLRSDPPFVYALFGVTIAALVAMIAGFHTRVATLLAWWLVEQIYRYSPIFYNGGDLVVRIFLFLGVFTDWGRAYSLDTWRARRREILAGTGRILPLEPIPAWPLRLAMLQLTIIYTATGWLKMGTTWWNGTALYYALSLDHFARFPMTGVAAVGQRIGVLPVLTHLVHAWEMLFPAAMVGAAMRWVLRHRRAGTWRAAPWRRWLGRALFGGAAGVAGWVGGRAAAAYLPPGALGLGLGLEAKRVLLGAGGLLFGAGLFAALTFLCVRRPAKAAWIARGPLGLGVFLGFGALMHAEIDLTMNVGIFPQVMVATYPAWWSGRQVDALWRLVGTRAAPAAQGARGWSRIATWPVRLVRRVPRPLWTVAYAADDAAVRRATLLRPWDLAGRLAWVRDGALPRGAVELRAPGGARLSDARAGRVLARCLPGLWALLPIVWVAPVGRLVARRFIAAGVGAAARGVGRSDQ